MTNAALSLARAYTRATLLRRVVSPSEFKVCSIVNLHKTAPVFEVFNQDFKIGEMLLEAENL